MHSILLRQMKKLKLYRDTPPDHAAWQLFLDRVDAAYTAADEERYTLERSLKVSSEEMQTLYQQLKTSSEARIRAIADALPDLLFLIDEDGLYLEVFAAASIDKLYKAPEDQKGKRLTDVLPPDQAEKFKQVMHSSLDEGEVQVADNTLDVPCLLYTSPSPRDKNPKLG